MSNYIEQLARHFVSLRLKQAGVPFPSQEEKIDLDVRPATEKPIPKPQQEKKKSRRVFRFIRK